MSIKIPSVPFNTSSDIPFVPNPNNNVKFQMGGTTPPYNSSTFYINEIYKDDAPHLQNNLTPYSILGKKSFDINSNQRKCYNIYSSGQNMVGRVCTTPGTDGPLYSSDIINGNANWVRGNQFGVEYDKSIINDRTKYILNPPSLKENNKTYINYDQFYPIPSINNLSNDKYNENGYPTWKYPYSIKSNKTISTDNIYDIDIFENFSNKNNIRVYFWIGIITIVSSLVFCKKILK